MKFNVKCPKCEGINAVDVDTSLADHGDVYNDVVECGCGEAFMLRTTITTQTEVLAVAPPETNKDWQWHRQIKRLLGDLEKHLSSPF